MLRRSIGRKSAVTSAIDEVEKLEDRKLMAVSPASVAGIKLAKRVDADGTALNSNRITVAFRNRDGSLAALRLGDVTKFRSFGYANDLTTANGQRKATVGMTISIPETGVLQIITDRLIRKGSRLQILQGALTDSRGRDIIFDASSASRTITFTKGQNKPRYTLSNRMFVPTDLSYFTQQVYSGAPAATTASTPPSAASVRTSLSAFLNAKVSRGLITAADATNAVAIFDSQSATDLIPIASLRAGLASLVGTVAAPAINSYLGTRNVTGKSYSVINFSSDISAGAPVGETKISAKGRLTLLIRPTYAGEDFRALSAVLAHEAIHQDTAAASSSNGVPPNSQDEEIIANTVQTTVYIQQATVDPSFVGNGTRLVTQLNDQALAILNSGDTLFPYGGIFQAPALTNGGNVFVGGKTNVGNFGNNTPVKSFEDFIRREYVFRGFTSGGTTASPTAVAIIRNIVGPTGGFTLLGTDAEKLLDKQNLVLTDVTYIRMAQALKLNF